MRFIEIKGVRTNNLKNISINIPIGKIIAVVGISGAGKSSFAFSTLYAEGYLRYIESLSPYIRQFLDRIEKPDVDSIKFLPPSISFKHKKPVKNPRSIVATASDIYDSLRLLYSKVSDLYCPECGKKIEKFTIDEILNHLLLNYKNKKIMVVFSYKGEISFLLNRGYYFYFEDMEKKRINSKLKNKKINVIIDEFKINKDNTNRLFEALDKAISLSNNYLDIYIENSLKQFPLKYFCSDCNIEFQNPNESLFSFNSANGACPKCNGFGDVQVIDKNLVFDFNKSINQNGILALRGKASSRFLPYLKTHAKRKGINLNIPIKKLSDDEIDFLIFGDNQFEGLGGFFQYIKKKSYKVQARVYLSRYQSYKTCDKCEGKRLNTIALSYKIKSKSIGDLIIMNIGELYDFINSLKFKGLKKKISEDILKEIKKRLEYLVNSGLSYLTLNRKLFTLSRGEIQRINLAFIFGSSLSDSLLVIDQPSADLHPSDLDKIKLFFENLKNNGNTIIFIDHNKNVIKYADYILELGPYSGERGGEIVYFGKTEEFFKRKDTISQKFFSKGHEIKKEKNLQFDNFLEIKNANSNNLKNIDIKIPENSFTVVCGVSGSGKTTLIYNELYKKNHVINKEKIFIESDINGIRASSIVANYFNILKPIREFFSTLNESRINGFTPGHFSFNSQRGKCLKCNGKGFIEIEMQFLPSIKLKCNDCDGTGYRREILKVKYKNKSIYDVLGMSFNMFSDFFKDEIPVIMNLVNIVKEMGMGYLKLGQKLGEMSEGELNRIKLIKYLNTNKRNSLFIIDEPSFGLHLYDIQMIKNLILRLKQKGNTVIAAEHNFELIAFADYVIELGPEGGDRGGYKIFEGYFKDFLKDEKSITSKYLKKY